MRIIIMTLLLCYCIISYLVFERICWYFSSASEAARVRCLQREGERGGGGGGGGGRERRGREGEREGGSERERWEYRYSLK